MASESWRTAALTGQVVAGDACRAVAPPGTTHTVVARQAGCRRTPNPISTRAGWHQAAPPAPLWQALKTNSECKDPKMAMGCVPHRHSRLSQCLPRHPLAQRQAPVWGWQDTLWTQSHCSSHLSPKYPGGHAVGRSRQRAWVGAAAGTVCYLFTAWWWELRRLHAHKM